MNSSIEIVSEDARMRPVESEVNRLYGDNSLLKEIADWEPIYSGIDGFRSGLKLTADWFSNPENLLRYKTNIYSV